MIEGRSEEGWVEGREEETDEWRVERWTGGRRKLERDSGKEGLRD